MTGRARQTGFLVGIACLLALAGGAHAQVFYSFPGARPVTDSSVALGLVSGFGDNLVRLGGFGRFNLTPASDLGLEVIWDNVDAESGDGDTDFWGAGIDGKVLLVSAEGGSAPVDIAVQAGGGFETRSDFLNIHVPFGGLASRDFIMNDGRRITPYGGVYFVYDYVKVDFDGGSESDSDFDVEMRVGASAEIVKRGSLFAALHAGNGTVFFLGFNTGF